jgi:hypothetical protein
MVLRVFVPRMRAPHPLPLQSHSSVAILWHHLPSVTCPSCRGGEGRRAADDSSNRSGWQQIGGGGLVRGISGRVARSTRRGGGTLCQMKVAASGGKHLLAVFVRGINQFLTLS